MVTLDETLVVSIPSAAKLLNLTPETVRMLTKEGDIPSTKIGARVMIPTAYLRKVAEA